MRERTITFTAPNGQKLTRRTAKTYTHAIIYPYAPGKWRIGSCVGRPDLVPARLEQWGKGSPDVIAVPVDTPEIEAQAARDAEAAEIARYRGAILAAADEIEMPAHVRDALSHLDNADLLTLCRYIRNSR